MRYSICFLLLFGSSIIFCQNDCFDKSGFTEITPLMKVNISFKKNDKTKITTFAAVLNEDICIDEGDICQVALKDGEILTFENKKSFNCKGVAFYWIKDEDLRTFKAKGIDYISISTFKSAKASIITSSQMTQINQSIDCILN